MDNDVQTTTHDEFSAIAIIGLACRFPGAPDLDSYWDLLKAGVESISFFEDVPADDPVANESPEGPWVYAHGLLDHIDCFDAAFFGVPAAEAGLMDPQQRLLIEVAWHALEHAGYNPDTHGQGLAVYAGASQNFYLFGLLNNSPLVSAHGRFQLSIANSRDHLTPRLSYVFNLSGPSIPVQTACSTSLVATHLACQSLIHGECDMALAGGSSLTSVERKGYRFRTGGIFSPDGHCRAFDATAQGTVPSEGVAMVLLKRFQDALVSGDTIHAVISGSAVNNDGGNKIGYTAPGVEGQRRVIEEALAVADLESGDISFVEAHGTGTQLGDPIEFKALQSAFANSTKLHPNAGCALGSVKTNIGHCDATSGMAGLIKIMLCLKHRTLVPTLHFTQGNPQIDFENSFFFVNTKVREWSATPRHAGISSFGIGGTNAHVIVSEGPPPCVGSPATRCQRLVTLSGASESTARSLASKLATFQRSASAANLDDAIFSLNLGRKSQPVRGAAVVENNDEFCLAMENLQPRSSRLMPNTRPEIVFMFPGQGALLESWGNDLFSNERVFREALQRCSGTLEHLLSVDIASVLFSDDPDERVALQRPSLFQPALFSLEYALAELWCSWGVRPDALIGHSLGEYVAATLAGVLSLEDALTLVAERGKWCEHLPPGAMLAVEMDAADMMPLLGDDLSLAAFNGPTAVVVSGTVDGISRLDQSLDNKVRRTRLLTERAFHSAMVDPILPWITELVSSLKMGSPTIPLISNITGEWHSGQPATSYWADHLRSSIQFEAGLATLAAKPGRILLEVGPVSVLTRLARSGASAEMPSFSSFAHGQAASASMLRALGDLWIEGITPNWDAFYAEEQRCRVPLPLYPYDHRSFWLIDKQSSPIGEGSPRLDRREVQADWLFLPCWRRRATPLLPPANTLQDQGWLLFVNSFDDALASRLRSLGQSVIEVCQGNGFMQKSDHQFFIDARLAGDYQSLWGALASREKLPSHLVHSWLMSGSADGDMLRSIGFDSLVLIAKALAVQPIPVRLSVVTRGMQRIATEMELAPHTAALLGLLRVLAQEHGNVICRSIDLEYTATRSCLDALIRELMDLSDHAEVACRGGRHWLPDISRTSPPDPMTSPFREDGVYVICHGLSESGLVLTEQLAARQNLRLCLLDRQFFPQPKLWPQWLAEQGEDDPISRTIRRLQPFESQIEIHGVSLSELPEMSKLFDSLTHDHSSIQGIIHLHVNDEYTFLQNQTLPVQGLVRCFEEVEVLMAILGGLPTPVEFLVVCSENPLEASLPGKVGHAAGAAFLASFADRCDLKHKDLLESTAVVSIGWGMLQWQAAAPASVKDERHQARDAQRTQPGINPEEYIQCLEWALVLGEPSLYVSCLDYSALAKHHLQDKAVQQQISQAIDSHPRPDLSSPYVAPTGDLEVQIADCWHALFAVDRIGANDDFFELGGHSLLAVQLLGRLNDSFDCEFTSQTLFDFPTITGLAKWLEQAQLNADHLLDEIEGLSDDELDALLNEDED